MGMAILCDGCGKDIQMEDRFNVSSHSIQHGSVQIDLCWPCAAPIRKVDGYVKEAERIAGVIEANKTKLYPDPAPTIHN